MVRMLRANNPSPMTLDGTRTYILGFARPLVIDPGPEDAAHLAAIQQALGDAPPLAILLTHAHADHAAAAASLARRTGAPVCMGKGALRPYFPEASVGRWLGEDDVLEGDAGPLRVIATPGHAPEHLSFWWTGPEAPDGGALFVGDLFMGEGDTTLVASPEGDLAVYLRSLDRVEELAPGVLYPAHGPPLADARQAVYRYRAHRLERIEQVRSALLAAPQATVEELVEAVYGPDLSAGLRQAAAGSLRAILAYLHRELH